MSGKIHRLNPRSNDVVNREEKEDVLSTKLKVSKKSNNTSTPSTPSGSPSDLVNKVKKTTNSFNFVDRFIRPSLTNRTQINDNGKGEEEEDLEAVTTDTIPDENVSFLRNKHSDMDKRNEDEHENQEGYEFSQGRISGNRIIFDDIYDDFKSGNLEKIRDQEPPYVPHMDDDELGQMVTSYVNRVESKSELMKDPKMLFVYLVAGYSSSALKEIGTTTVSSGTQRGGLNFSGYDSGGRSNYGQGRSGAIIGFSPLGNAGNLGNTGLTGNREERRGQSLTPGRSMTPIKYPSSTPSTPKPTNLDKFTALSTPASGKKSGRVRYESDVGYTPRSYVGEESEEEEEEESEQQQSSKRLRNEPLGGLEGRRQEKRQNLMDKALEMEMKNNNNTRYREGNAVDLLRLAEDPKVGPKVKDWLSRQRMFANMQWLERPEVMGVVEFTPITMAQIDQALSDLVRNRPSFYGITEDDLIDHSETRGMFAKAVGWGIQISRYGGATRQRFTTDLAKYELKYSIAMKEFDEIDWDSRSRKFYRNGAVLINRTPSRQQQNGDLDPFPISKSGFLLPREYD